MKSIIFFATILISTTTFCQVGIGKINPTFILDINSRTLNLNGINLEHTNFNSQFLAENSTRSLVFNNSLTTGLYNYRFAGATRFIMDNVSLRPAVNSNDNLTLGGIDIGRFDFHFRRIYTQGIHTNDDNAAGGLRINIGAGGGTAADYVFSDFALYPVLNNNRDLGRNGNAWRTLYYQNAVQTSDSRLKKNILENNKGLITVKSMKTFTYNYIDDETNKMHYGFMAQDFQKILPALVDDTNKETGMLAVNYIEVVPVLVKAIQEQNEIIESQALKIEKLEKEMALIKSKLGI
jgi:hypothetical protein